MESISESVSNWNPWEVRDRESASKLEVKYVKDIRIAL